jgi:hypothetical protein
VLLTAVVVSSVVLLCLAVLQAGLAGGLPWGRLAWGGQHRVLPSRLRVGSAVSIVAYACFAAILLTAAGSVRLLGDGFTEVAIWVLTGYFALGVVVNGVSRSPVERAVMTPVCVVLAACCLVVALS